MKGKKLSHKERMEKIEADKNERRRIFKELCTHLSRGYSMESFAELSVPTIKRYINLFKEEFIQEEIDEALSRGRAYWEEIGHRQAQGECLGNSRTLYYNMSNKYGWSERQQIEADHKGSVSVNVISYATQKAS